jgi:flagellar biosynthesis protein FlhB
MYIFGGGLHDGRLMRHTRTVFSANGNIRDTDAIFMRFRLTVLSVIVMLLATLGVTIILRHIVSNLPKTKVKVNSICPAFSFEFCKLKPMKGFGRLGQQRTS